MLLLFAITLNACVYYRTVPVAITADQTWPKALSVPEAPLGTEITFINGENAFYLTDPTYSEQTISGQLKRTPFFSVPDKKNFLRKNVPELARPFLVRTLYVTTDTPLEEGPFSLDINQANSLTRYSVNGGATFAASTGMVLGSVLVGSTAFLLIACNCPRVYALNPDGSEQAMGSILTGAIASSFERQDLLPLPQLDRSGEEIVLSIANELPEDEFVNELKLFKVAHRQDYQIGHDATGSLFEYKNPLLPLSANASDGSDVLENVLDRDEAHYGFAEETYQPELNSVVVRFDKSQLHASPAKLIIHARQTEWLEQVAESFFSLYGNEFEQLNQRMEKASRRFYDRYNARQGISMTAYLKTRRGWQEIGVFQNAGIIQPKLMGLDLDLSKVPGDEVEIKLEAAFRFWELDQIGLVQDWQTLEPYTEVPMQSALNEAGQDVRALIQNADDQYARQPSAGSHIQLRFENTAQANELYVLQGTGYYRHVREYSHAPQQAQIKQLRSRGKLAAHELSLSLHQYARLMAEQ
jgi:hypothetical protein